MKQCPKCGNRYNDEMNYCVVDNATLTDAKSRSDAETLSFYTAAEEANLKELYIFKRKYAWLLGIAERQKYELPKHIHLAAPNITQHQLDHSPHIEFSFTIENRSVYPVYTSGLRGSIYFQNRPLNGDLSWVDDAAKVIQPFDFLGGLRLRQELTNEDIVYILNEPGPDALFNFSNVEIGVTGAPEHPYVEQQFLSFHRSVSGAELLKAYKRLRHK